MATRVFELARELGVTSKAVLQKCQAEGLAIKNHMSSLTLGQEATVREWFAAEAEASGTALETTEHINLEQARAEAEKKRRSRKKAEAEAAAEQPPAEDEVAVAETPTEEPEAGQAAEQAAREIAAEEASETVQAEAPGETEADPTEQAAAQARAETEAPQPRSEEASAQPETTEAHQPAETEATGPETHEQPPAEETAEPQPSAAAETPVKADSGEAETEAGQPSEKQQAEAGEETDEDDVQPAGPKLVPKPAALKGPRVVRVEKPDIVPGPRQRGGRRSSGGPKGPRGPRGPRGPGRGGPPQPATPERGPSRGGMSRKATGKKSKKRSPRRRSGRSADSGERLKEWRNQDLLERQERLQAAATGLRRHRPSVSGKRSPRGSGVKTGVVSIEEPITVKSLSAATGVKAADIIRKLMQDGILATVNQTIDRETAESVMADYEMQLQVEVAKTPEEELVERLNQREKSEEANRAPVVTFLGHVDHGKTSLLDRIRESQVASGEAGGITQHIGAYRLDRGNMHVVFLDTPGHEAFTAMRSRGAKMTDVVVLVVAADDGVMPQTIEAINHAKAAEVPIVVALNKVDVPNANIQRALGQLAEHGLQPRQWGGEVEVVETSAETGAGIEDLIEILSLEAELLELKAEQHAPASGYVVEAEMNPSIGTVATLLVRNGTLKLGDTILAGQGHGRVRQITNDKGEALEQAGPATPVQITGLDAVPEAGDRFYAVEDIDEARTVAQDRRERTRQKQLARTPKRTLKSLFDQFEAGEASEVSLIIKADVSGSMEALVASLEKLSTAEARVNIIHTGVGGVSTGDVTLADASGAIIIGFHVVADAAARQLAEEKGVEIRTYRVIYDVIEDIRKVMEEGLEPELREETIGRAEVRETFKISRLGTIAGCHVLDGTVNRNARVRITRDGVVIEDERALDSLKRFKDDVREVRAGMECGLKISGYDNIQEGDILEFYRTVEVARTL
ncbi:MAG: translation initiation factor IF-2 [Planctomycetota bacterium]